MVNETHGIIFLLVDDLGINLRYLHLGMSHQLACGIDVRTQCEHHCAKGMSAAMEGDRLGYTSLVKPWLKVELGVDLTGMFSKIRSSSVLSPLSGIHCMAFFDNGM